MAENMKWSVKFLRVENNKMILWFVVVIGVSVGGGGGVGWGRGGMSPIHFCTYAYFSTQKLC